MRTLIGLAAAALSRLRRHPYRSARLVPADRARLPAVTGSPHH
ncbi:hypothetical protein ABZW32_16750 [Streptomyces sp. NPDC004667]